MEMDSGRRRRLLLMGLGVVLALVAGFAAYTLGSQPGAAVEEVERQAVLVAARDIDARTNVVSDDFRIVQVPVDSILPQAVREGGIVDGRLTAIQIFAGQQVTPNLFATGNPDQEFEILGIEEVVTTDSPYWRAVSVQVPRHRAVAGQISDGQRVDLFVTIDMKAVVPPDGATGLLAGTACTDFDVETGQLLGNECLTTKLTYQDLEVLKANPEENLYILKVDLHQSEEINHIAQFASDGFSLVLRPEQDTRQANADEYGETTDRIVTQYRHAVPLLVELGTLLGFPVDAPPVTPAEPSEPEQPEEPDLPEGVTEPDDGETAQP
jgi:Flp pilus assembly protein CpaB